MKAENEIYLSSQSLHKNAWIYILPFYFFLSFSRLFLVEKEEGEKCIRIFFFENLGSSPLSYLLFFLAVILLDIFFSMNLTAEKIHIIYLAAVAMIKDDFKYIHTFKYLYTDKLVHTHLHACIILKKLAVLNNNKEK